jgi:hypothetical protein
MTVHAILLFFSFSEKVKITQVVRDRNQRLSRFIKEEENIQVI